ncbi:uncharacterized protein [Ambystoma mexicanum]|uniref:uncharacterized protein isoform X2 n=1 Tax=Ambystoma mexicanum TaxID=8296 RepID=UPI0037E8E6EC
MLKTLTKKLRNQSLSEIQPFKLKISCPLSDEEDSEDSEGENQELAQIDKERRRNCTLTPLAINQLQNQENQCCTVRALFHASLDRHSSEEELERISREFAAEKRKWSQVGRLGCLSDTTSSSDEEVKNLCGMSFKPVEQAAGLHATPSPVPFSASPPKRLQPLIRNPSSRPLIYASVGPGFEQGMPFKRHKQCFGDKASRPSLDLEKMQQMLMKKSCGAKTRVIKIRLERTRGGSTSNQEIDENTELGKENLCQVAKGDHVLLRNFNRRWNQQRFTGPHLVEDVSTRAVKLKDKRAWNHLHDVKIYKLQTRPSANDRSIGKTPTTSPAAEENTTTDNDPIVPSERITDEEGGDPHTAHPMVTRSKSKTAPTI